MPSTPPSSSTRRVALTTPMTLLSLSMLFPSPAMAATPAPSNLPRVDFSKMGNVGLGGSFSGLDWWSSSSPFAANSSSSPSISYSSDGDTLLLRSDDGSYTPLGTTNAGGSISAVCWSNAATEDGVLYLGGSFTSLSGTPANNIASYSISSSSFSALSTGMSGAVDALYCDNAHSQVWVGGMFTSPSEHVALWSISSSSWSPVPFGGLNGPVSTISSNPSGSSVYFGGHFITSFSSNSTSISTRLAGNITSIPSAPTDTLTTGNSGYLTPVTIPLTNFASITISATPNTDQRLFADPNVLVCPGEATWLAKDGQRAEVDIKGDNYMRASGARIVNGLVQGRGTSVFSMTVLPDGNTLSLTYTDPSSGGNRTCTDSCPLSADSSVSGQDFVFTDGPQDLTGLRMDLKEWIGDGAGLGSIQLLTDGAYGSAVASTNQHLCPGDNSASTSLVQETGDWTVGTSNTTNPDTVTYYLTTSVPVSKPTYPSVTFYPYVASAAIYDVYVVIPGCRRLGDCDGRTSIDVEVMPVRGSVGWTSTISEQVQEDARTLVYSGPVGGGGDGFNPSVAVSLAKSPTKPAGDNYVVVADAVQLVLTGISGGNSSSSASSVNGTIVNNSTSTLTSAFGVYEYVRSANSTINASASALSNSTETALSKLGIELDSAYNASNSPSAWSVNAIAALGDDIYVGGQFSVSGNYSNVVSIDTSTGQSAVLAAGGLNGVVHAAVVIGTSVYLGGEFTSTQDGSTQLSHLAKWDTADKSWSGLADGVNGIVSSLIVSDTNLLVLGKFSTASTSTGGFAIWDTTQSAWSTSGIVFGDLTAGAVSNKDGYLAGSVIGMSMNRANGVAMLSTGSDGSPTISSINVPLGSTGSAPASSSISRRSHTVRSSLTRNFLSRFTDSMAPRSNHFTSRDTAPAIPSTSVAAPAVLAGAFFTNSRASESPTVTILGGNFTSSNSSVDVEGVAFYAEGAGLTGPRPPVRGLVKALAVIGQDLYVGGSGVNVSEVGTGLVVYNLDSQSWIRGGMPSLNPAPGLTLSVNAIRSRDETTTVVVAGNFGTAGSLTCNALCLWDSTAAQWSTPGSGLGGGEVRAMDFAGVRSETLIVSGSIVLPSGQVSYLAAYSFDNSSWVSLGTLPGPALAVAVDDRNASNIFAAGYGRDNTPYLQLWDGAGWSEQSSSLLPGTLVQQLAFVPMSDEHEASGSIEKDRMLMVSGSLYLDDVGNATSALYDGATMHPFLIATTSTGGLGSTSLLFWSESSFSFAVRQYLARGLVVLVAIAIATGLVLLMILLVLLIACCARRRDRNRPVQHDMMEKEGSETSSTHQHVFNSVQAALEQSLVGAAVMGRSQPRRRSDPSSYGTGTGMGVAVDGAEDEEQGRETTMRYDFDGPELQPGEMSMRAGQRIVVLDDVQSDEWWYARDPGTGREGVVPATYVW